MTSPVATYLLTNDLEFYETGFLRYRAQHKMRRFVLIVKWIGTFVLASAIPMALTFQRGTAAWGPAVAVAAAIIFIWLSPKIDLWWMWRRLRRDPMVGRPVRMSLDEQGFQSSTEGASSNLSWKLFSRAVRFADGWILFRGPRLYFWLADASASDETTVAKAGELIRKHVTIVAQR